VLSAVLRPEQDAFGRLLMDLVSGQQVDEIVERDDGFVFASDGRYYLAPFRRWWPQERRAMRFVRGRVLDLGCGAGRVSLHLQNRGLDVVGVDVSPMAVATARRRGVADARVGTVATALTKGQLFDTILLLGNNLEVTQLAAGMGWRTARFIGDGPGYVAVLKRTHQP
jgi:SAM-dependent methyltransferase